MIARNCTTKAPKGGAEHLGATQKQCSKLPLKKVRPEERFWLKKCPFSTIRKQIRLAGEN